MVTKRMILGAGALALALMVSACSEDRAGGATGLDQAAAAPRVNPPPAAAITVPATPEGVKPGGGGSGGGVATVVSSSVYQGHQVVLSEVTTAAGPAMQRLSFDGVTMAEYTSAMDGAAPISATVFADGQVLLQDAFTLSDAGSIVIPQQYLGLTAPRSGGPQLQADLPCAAELTRFGGASLWLSVAMMWAKVQPFSFAAWLDMRFAIGAVAKTSWDLLVCLKRAW